MDLLSADGKSLILQCLNVEQKQSMGSPRGRTSTLLPSLTPDDMMLEHTDQHKEPMVNVVRQLNHGEHAVNFLQSYEALFVV